MRILFKQFLKTFFRKNIFLSLGLGILVTILSFVISSAINVSQSFNQALTTLDANSNKAEVVGNIPSDFGRLDFALANTQPTQPVKAFVSTLSIKPDPKNGNFTRDSNTIFPYTQNELKSRDGVGISNITVNQDGIFNFGQGNGIWNYNYGLSVLPLFGGSFDKPNKLNKAIAIAFVDDKSGSAEVEVNPQELLFNKYGLPFALFSKGNLSNEFNILITFNANNPKFDSSSEPLYDSQTGLGNTQTLNKQSSGLGKNDLHNDTRTINLNIADSWLWNHDEKFINDVFSKFIALKTDIKPIKIDLDLNESYGPIKVFLEQNPDFFVNIFNRIFPIDNITRNPNDGVHLNKITEYDNSVVSSVSLIKNQSNSSSFPYSIQLAIPDEMFIDPLFKSTSSDSTQQEKDKQAEINKNKTLYINNFTNYLNSRFIQEFKNEFDLQMNAELNKNNIQSKKQSEYYYIDPSSDNEYLFIKKGRENFDKLYISQGSGLDNNGQIENIIAGLNSLDKNGLRSKQMFYSFKQLLDLIPDDILSSSLSDSSINKNNETYKNSANTQSTAVSIDNQYQLFQLMKFCLNQIVTQLDSYDKSSDIIPEEFYKDNEYLYMFCKLINSDFKILRNTNNISLKFNFQYDFKTIWMAKTVAFPYFANYLCVISEAYATENKKRYLPLSFSQTNQELWNNEMNKINSLSVSIDEKTKLFSSWLDTINNTDAMYLSFDFINQIFSKNAIFFNIWLSKLSNDFKIKYNETYFLINGFGTSSDFAYPVMSPTNPIPSVQKQGLVFINDETFDSLGVSDVNIFSYYTFYSNTKNNQEIINSIKTWSNNLIGTDLFNLKTLDEATNLGSVFIRNYFPTQIRNLLIIASVIISVVLVILSLVVIYLLLSSFIKNLLEPISLTIANGISLKKIIIASSLSLFILTALANIIGFIAAFLSQNAFISLFSSIWMVPGTVALGFSPLIFIPLIILTFLTFGGILSWLLYRKFKKPIPDIIANKNDIKNNKLTNFIRNSKFRLPSMVKLSIGFSTINIGRLMLLGGLGSVALGLIVSGIIINDKFYNSQKYTLESRNYQYEYDLIDVNESTGLYKPQNFNELGMEDSSLGINSLYPQKQTDVKPGQTAPYYKDEFLINEIPKGGNKNDAVAKTFPDGSKKYLSNMIYPSYYIYQQIRNGKIDAFFNGVASAFLLDVSFSLFNENINIWDFITPYFPTWLVNQLNEQALSFQNYIMKYYGEWYYQFIELNPVNDKNLKYEILPNQNNSLSLNALDVNDSGMYLAYYPQNSPLQPKKYAYTKPYYVWVDQDQQYKTIAKETAGIFNQKTNDNLTLHFDLSQPDVFYKDKNTAVNPPNGLKPEDIKWVFFPAFDNYHELNPKKCANDSGNPNNFKYSSEFIKFISVIYGDERVSSQDSKISFGIIPVNKNEDETFSLVKGRIHSLPYFLNQPFSPKVSNISLYGIDCLSNNECIVLKDDNGNDIKKLIKTPSLNESSNLNNSVINVIINNGASMDYNLSVGSTFQLDVSNNSLQQSYELMANMVGDFQNNIQTKNIKFKVVGINNDSFGSKFYINQLDANKILGLDKMPVYTSMNPVSVQQKQKLSFVPFNGVFSKNKELLISKKSIPFYSFASIWNTTLDMNNVTPAMFNQGQLIDLLLSRDNQILIPLAEYINANYITDPQSKINVNQNNNLRADILKYMNTAYSFSSSLLSINSIDQKTALIPSLSSANSLAITNQMFNIISSLSTTIVVIGASIGIPLLLLVSLVTSLSMIRDLAKNIGLMKIMGYSNRNILITIGMMFIPVLLLTLLVGLGIMFAMTYGLQYFVFNLTSIFITPYVSASVYFIGVAVVLVILAMSLILIASILKKKSLQNTIKF